MTEDPNAIPNDSDSTRIQSDSGLEESFGLRRKLPRPRRLDILGK